jgi:predicted DNA-binding transcriptional regulator AlpA
MPPFEQTTRPTNGHDPEVGRPAVPLAERLLWSQDDISALIGLSRRSIERLRSAGRFPRPDLALGRRVLWRPETIRDWIDKQSGK